MDDKCVFKVCYSCSDNGRPQVSQNCERLHNIMKDSEMEDDHLHQIFRQNFKRKCCYISREYNIFL